MADALSARLLAAVAAHHQQQPLAAGMGREALRGHLPPVADPRLFQRLLARAVEAGTLALDGDLVRLPQHRAAASGAGGALKDRVAAELGRRRPDPAAALRAAGPLPRARPPRWRRS